MKEHGPEMDLVPGPPQLLRQLWWKGVLIPVKIELMGHNHQSHFLIPKKLHSPSGGVACGGGEDDLLYVLRAQPLGDQIQRSLRILRSSLLEIDNPAFHKISPPG